MLFDLICCGIALFLVVLGLFRGLIRQIFSLAGFVGGLVLARLFAETLGSRFAPVLGLVPALATIAFSIAIFICVEVLASLLGNFLHRSLGTILGLLDRLGGALLGLAKGLLVVWALASLAALLHAHLPSAERNLGLLGKLDLARSQAVRIARDASFLGDVDEQLRAARAQHR